MLIEELTKALWMLYGSDENVNCIVKIEDNKIYMMDGRVAFVDMLARLYDKVYSS